MARFASTILSLLACATLASAFVPTTSPRALLVRSKVPTAAVARTSTTRQMSMVDDVETKFRGPLLAGVLLPIAAAGSPIDNPIIGAGLVAAISALWIYLLWGVISKAIPEA
eukprot:CAMPEP_0185744394 /NCGR_PEP_ID=MMETSP1174-20130828/2470_1 /TAXON_ID=35687 /ORGANISM="Dictyocha speculum, Strain CCMP1381" /LENGTH=111 /DNA_ID=CAMNT_0028417747 /DNA_START=41 /DNA_END=376 /DNA_ORIENTATION=-